MLLAAPLLAALGCEPDGEALDASERAAVAEGVGAALQAFEAAQRARNADSAVALMAPDFFMYVDGARQDYDSTAEGVRRSFASLQHVEPGFRDIHIRPLSKTSAVASFRFRDSLVTAAGGIMRFTGATTLVWERREGRWVMTYGHADHRPVEQPRP